MFGSALRDDFGPHSDIDVLVTYLPEIQAKISLWDNAALMGTLRELWRRPVDLVDPTRIIPGLRREIIGTQRFLYVE